MVAFLIFLLSDQGVTLQSDPIIAKLTVLNVQLLTSVQSIAASALVDSGSSGNFISQDLIDCLHLPRQWHARELRVETIIGKPLGRGCVRFETPPLRLWFRNLHEEEFIFLLLEEATVDLILGHPWLIIHSPEIRWETSEVIHWSEFCHQHCLKGIPRLQSPATQVATQPPRG